MNRFITNAKVRRNGAHGHRPAARAAV